MTPAEAPAAGKQGEQGEQHEHGVPLALDQRAAIESALARLAHGGPAEHALSDPSFANLYLFRRVHAYRYHAGEHPWISGATYDGGRHALPLFDPALATEGLIEALLQNHDFLYPMAQAQVDRLDGERFAWSASRDDADYLYDAARFRDYRGTALNKKRNLVRQLLAHHEVHSSPYGEADSAAALHVLEAWMVAKGKAPGEADEEACGEALQDASRFGLLGFIHRVDGEPAGFVLAEAIRPGVFVMRFAKGLDRFKGIHQHMFQHFCHAVPEARWLNFEQDLGVANFRRSKLSYQPVALLPKYRVTLRTR